MLVIFFIYYAIVVSSYLYYCGMLFCAYYVINVRELFEYYVITIMLLLCCYCVITGVLL